MSTTQFIRCLTRLSIISNILMALLVSASTTTHAQGAVKWWLTTATLKVTPSVQSPADLTQPLILNAARGEYVPFQIVMQGQAQGQVNLSITYDDVFLDIALYDEQYLELPPLDASLTPHRLTDSTVPDALLPFPGGFPVSNGMLRVIWVDVYVPHTTPPGEYPISFSVSSREHRSALVRVADFDLPNSGGVNTIIPLQANWTIPHYAFDDHRDYHIAVNQVLMDHLITPGSLVTQPRWTGIRWDFTAMNEELATLPQADYFLAPIPYNRADEAYFFSGDDRRPYTTTDFDNPAFVEYVESFFPQLVDYLTEQGRLDGALVFPADERLPINDALFYGGPDTLSHLMQWTELIRAAGLPVITSGVLPVPQGPTNLGWPPSQDITNYTNTHVDLLDAAPELFADWDTRGGNGISAALQGYGDFVDLPAALQRGLLWHLYGRDIPLAIGSGALVWANNDSNLINPLDEAVHLSPEPGYGSGALLYPDLSPSIRLKMLREGIEDTRLLELYGERFGLDTAVALARCHTGPPMAEQNPAPQTWDQLHDMLVAAIAQNQALVLDEVCPTQNTPAHSDEAPLGILDDPALTGWDFSSNPGELEDNTLNVVFDEQSNEIGYFLDGEDWSAWEALQVTIINLDPYFSELEIGLVDGSENFVLLHGQALWLPPNGERTLTLPLTTQNPFDWTDISYLNIEVITTATWRNATGEINTSSLGSRRLRFTDFVLVR